MSKRYCFERDDSGHDYLIPAELKEEFNRLLYEEEDEFAFIEKFDDMRIGCSPSLYSFEKPEMMK